MAKRILVVDDDENILNLEKTILEQKGFEVIGAGGGAEALTLLASSTFDLVLLDVMMPELDGAGTLAALRAAEETRGIPVVFLTAKALPAEVERLKSLGAVDVLTKPFEPRELAAQLRTAVAGR